MLEPTLTDGQVYVAGRGEKEARALYAQALKNGFDPSTEILTTSHGYIVPEGLLDDDSKAVRREDQPAVPTEPGTTTDPLKAWNADAWKVEQEQIKQHGVDAAQKVLVDPVEKAQAKAEEADDPHAAKRKVPVASKAKAEETAEEADGGFDPLDHTVAEVIEYLESADDKERERVLKAESESESPRKGITKLAEDKEGDK